MVCSHIFKKSMEKNIYINIYFPGPLLIFKFIQIIKNILIYIKITVNIKKKNYIRMKFNIKKYLYISGSGI